MVTDQEIASCMESLLRPPPSGEAAAAGDDVHQVEDLAFIDGLQITHHRPSAHQPQILLHPFYHFPSAAFHFSPPMPVADAVAAASVSSAAHRHQQPDVVRPASAGSPRASAPPRIKRRRGPGGLTRLCGVSPELQVIVGEPALPRTQIVKQLWAYIRKNNLQDPNNKRKIICNDELRLVLETDCTDIFKMNKLLAKHITPLEPTKDGPGSKKLKATAAIAETAPGVGPYPMVISDALAEFLGTGEKELLQSEVLRFIWNYINVNQLEDPVNTMMILCDSKLERLFGCDNLVASELSAMVACHLYKKS